MIRRYLFFLSLVLGMMVSSTGIALALEPTFAQGQNFEMPIRQQAIIATKDGYYPKNFSVFAGEKILFFFTTTSDTPSCLLLPVKEISISVVKGKVTEAQAFFDSPGNYRFYCPTNKLEGSITVLGPPDMIQQRKRERELASERPRIWMPREDRLPKQYREQYNGNDELKSYD